MSKITRLIATIITMSAAYALLSLALARPESATPAKKGHEMAGGPPAISPFDAMKERGKDLPLENWGPAY
jgi:hypothetical protein